MKGTEKQVAWAEEIKKGFAAKYEELLASNYEETGECQDLSAEVVCSFLIGGESELPNRKYAEFKEGPEYENYKAHRNEMTKEEKNAFLKGHKRAFRKEFMDSIAKALENEDAKFWIDHGVR